jgi:hypothetical protein
MMQRRIARHAAFAVISLMLLCGAAFSRAAEGPGAIAGVDNGDPTSHEPFKATKRKAFHGLCLAVVKAARTPGEIRLTATSPGLESQPAAITTVSPAAGR